MDYRKRAVLERRNPQPVKAEGSERAAPERLLQGTSDTRLDSIKDSLSDSIPLSATLRLESNSQGRKSVRVNALGWGLKLDSYNRVQGYPRLSLRMRPRIKACPSVDGGTREDFITLSAPAKQLNNEARLTKYPPEMAA